MADPLVEYAAFSTIANFYTDTALDAIIATKALSAHDHSQFDTFNDSLAARLAIYLGNPINAGHIPLAATASGANHLDLDGTDVAVGTELAVAAGHVVGIAGSWTFGVVAAGANRFVSDVTILPGADFSVAVDATPILTVTPIGEFSVTGDLTCAEFTATDQDTPQDIGTINVGAGYNTTGNTGDSLALSVVGDTLVVNGNDDFFGGVAFGGTVVATAFDTPSSIRFKKDVRNADRRELAKAALSAETVEYSYVGEARRRFGIIADSASEIIAPGHSKMNIGATLTCMVAAILEVADAQDAELARLGVTA